MDVSADSDKKSNEQKVISIEEVSMLKPIT